VYGPAGIDISYKVYISIVSGYTYQRPRKHRRNNESFWGLWWSTE